MTNPITAVFPDLGDSEPVVALRLISMGLVALTVVPDEEEAEIIRGLLRANGIKSSHRGTVLTASVWPVGSTSPIEVLVDESDLARARKVLEDQAR